MVLTQVTYDPALPIIDNAMAAGLAFARENCEPTNYVTTAAAAAACFAMRLTLLHPEKAKQEQDAG